MFNDPIVNKLIILFVFEKLEIPLSEESLLNVCSSYNKWIPYIDCRQAIFELIEVGFIRHVKKGKDANFKLTSDGINCLSKFFTRIPSSLRKEITEYCRDNVLDLKRSQEFKADYFQNADGSYTVWLAIKDASSTPIFELKFNVQTREDAKRIYKKWQNKALPLYETIYDYLVVSED